jgi:hypothetical protein
MLILEKFIERGHTWKLGDMSRILAHIFKSGHYTYYTL